MRYLLEGYYGRRNLGDDLLLYVTLAEIQRVDPEACFTVISERSEVAPPGVRVRVVPGGRRLETARHLLRHDAWIFGGGGLFQDQSPHSLPYLRRLGRSAALARMLGRHIAILGVGVGPLTTNEGRAAAGRVLERASLVAVRDSESADLARELAPTRTIETTGDLAFLAPLPSRRPRSGGTTLGVSLLPRRASVGGDLREDLAMVEALVLAFRAVLSRHPEVRIALLEVFAGEVPGDASVLRALERGLPPERVDYHAYEGDLHSALERVASCDVFFGMRFHSCLLAHALGVPCLMVAYHPKSLSLAKAMELDPAAVLAPDDAYYAERVEARIERLLVERERFTTTGKTAVLAQAARRNFDLLADLLRGAAPDRIH